MNTPPRPPSAFHLTQQMNTLPNMPPQQFIQYAPSNAPLPSLVNQTTFPAVSQTAYSPMPFYAQNPGMSMSMYEPRQQPYFAQMPPAMAQPGSAGQPFDEETSVIPNANTFHLHQSNVS